jgi:RNA polymerase sigma-70 factor (ECF subfamily)
LALSIDDLWREAEAAAIDLERAELAQVLQAVGAKFNYGLPAGVQATKPQMRSFWQALQLKDLALAQACALGREAAWHTFLSRYREPLTQAAISITGSACLGQDLADSLYSEMFGLASRDGQRKSPLAAYAGRGSLIGFLRAALAQRHVDHHRKTHREVPLDGKDFAATQPLQTATETLARLRKSLASILGSLGPEERFLLSAWYLDEITLLEIGQVCKMHESTVSRQLKRLTERLKKELLKNLQASGLSKRAAEEALGIDPRDLRINLRSLLQTSQTDTFLQPGTEANKERA